MWFEHPISAVSRSAMRCWPAAATSSVAAYAVNPSSTPANRSFVTSHGAVNDDATGLSLLVVHRRGQAPESGGHHERDDEVASENHFGGVTAPKDRDSIAGRDPPHPHTYAQQNQPAEETDRGSSRRR